MFRVDGQLGVHVFWADQTLHEWHTSLQAGGRAGVLQDGYFATREGREGGGGGKLLDGGKLGLPDMAEVVLGEGLVEPGGVTTTEFRFLESGLARLVWLLTAGPASFFFTGVTLPGVTLLQVLGPGVREVFRVWVLVAREEWVLG